MSLNERDPESRVIPANWLGLAEKLMKKKVITPNYRIGPVGLE